METKSKTAITEDGERIPPIAGDKPCAEYDPAGSGAGVEMDGHPQCANCGHSKSLHPPQAVRIDERLLGAIGVREWGLPSLCVPGKMWRSEEKGTISCMTPKGSDRVNIETLPLVVVGAGEPQWMPDSWRASLWEYVQAWPSSGCEYGPFLAITEEERCDFLRKLAATLVASNNIGCRSIAHDIGMFASMNYELVTDV